MLETLTRLLDHFQEGGGGISAIRRPVLAGDAFDKGHKRASWSDRTGSIQQGRRPASFEAVPTVPAFPSPRRKAAALERSAGEVEPHRTSAAPENARSSTVD